MTPLLTQPTVHALALALPELALPELALPAAATWYLARATGIVAWALLALSVQVGLVQSTRLARGRPGPAWLRSFHGYAGALALALTVVHMVGLLLDRTVPFSLLDLLVPFASSWRPEAVALGVLGLYVMLAVQLTAWLRSRLPRGLWLKVHRIAALSYVLTTAHLLTAGTDVTNPGLLAAVLGSIVATGTLLMVRVRLATGAQRPRPRRSAGSAAVGG